jgi:hypothetical protein
MVVRRTHVLEDEDLANVALRFDGGDTAHERRRSRKRRQLGVERRLAHPIARRGRRQQRRLHD